MKIGIAQIRTVKGDITSNLEKHEGLIQAALSLKANAIFFPELSLTGYEPELANELATNPDDQRMDRFQILSDSHHITIGLGLPTKTDTGVRISMIIFQPDRPRLIYSKQQLHADELPYFEKGDTQITVTVENERITPAICYESLQPNHTETAFKLGTDNYLASVAKSLRGAHQGFIHYPLVARKYDIPVLMSNCVGYCDNFESVGLSSVWTKQGQLVGQMDDKSEGVLVFDTKTEKIAKLLI